MKKALFIVLFILLLGLGYVKFTYDGTVKKPLKIDGDITVNVSSGETFYSVLDRLNNSDSLKNMYLIKYYIKSNGLQCDIKPGDYKVSSDVSVEGLIKVLQSGEDLDSIKVTIIEGMNIEAMAETFEKSGLISKAEFLKSCSEYELPNYIKKDKNRKYQLEGYLYPDTYEFEKESSGKYIIDTMNGRFNDIIESIEEKYNEKIEDIDKVVTIASIVEKETDSSEERSKVASVFYNRMNISMPLQSCATVIYALGNDFYNREQLIVYNKDLEVDSPYNTYKVNGLPIGPISSPRKESIEAAFKPADTDYLYFVSNNDGTHFFTNDYNEFLNVKSETQGF